jgi:tetratricopeptide (TPR) repeat protein
MKPYLLILLLLAGSSLHCLAQSEKASRQEAKIQQKQIEQLTAAIRKKPETAELYVQRALSYSKLERYEEASRDLARALELDPDLGIARFRQAATLRNMGLWEQSLQESRRGIARLSPSDTLHISFLWLSSDAYVALGKGDSALYINEKILALQPENAVNYIRIATVLAEMERYEEGIGYLKQAASIRPEWPIPYLNLCYYSGLIADYQQGLSYGDTAVLYAREPIQQGVAYNNRAYCRIYLGDAEGALEDIAASLALYPDNPFTYRNRGLAYASLDDQAQACADFGKAVALGATGLMNGWIGDYCR